MSTQNTSDALSADGGFVESPYCGALDKHASGAHGGGDSGPFGQSEPVGTPRIVSLDFIRGVAVLGILLANITSFAHPFVAQYWPEGYLAPPTEADPWLWLAQFVLVDGKMRGLFMLLFGAGMVLFLDRAEEKGYGVGLQFRRLFWLLVFGLIHYFFIWRGDILGSYAIAGMMALVALGWQPKTQLIFGITLFLFGALTSALPAASLYVVAEQPIGVSEAAWTARGEAELFLEESIADGTREQVLISSGDFRGYIAHGFEEHASELTYNLWLAFLETVPVMVIGMALFRMGLFSGRIDPKRQAIWGWILWLSGAAITLTIGLWAVGGGLTYYRTFFAVAGLGEFTLLPMSIGLTALLALAAHRVKGVLGTSLVGAGRMAFSNYIGTSLLMLFVFHGWGLGLYGEISRPGLLGIVIATWIVLCAVSLWWLKRFYYGPLEWLWRCLTYWQIFPFRRA